MINLGKFWWNYTERKREQKGKKIGSGWHILFSNHLVSCGWARLSSHGRNGNYEDLQLVPPVQLLLLYHVNRERVFFAPSSVAEWLTYLTLIWSNFCIMCPFGAFFCAQGVLKSLPVFARIPMDVCFGVCVCVCVCLAWHPWVGWELQGLTGWGGGLWHSVLISQEALQKPELQPLKTMKRTRETLAHGGLGYLLTRPFLDLSVLRANPSHLMWHLYRSTCFGNTLYSLWESCSSTMLCFTTTCADSPARSSSWLIMFW